MRRPFVRVLASLPLALPSAFSLLGASCSTPTTPRLAFDVMGRLASDTDSCSTRALSALTPKTVRLSVRVRDADGSVARDDHNLPIICDATLDAVAGSVKAIPQLPSGGRADLFVEAFDASGARLADGALQNLDPTASPLPDLRLLPVGAFACLPPGAGSASDGQGKRLRLFQHRAFHTATTLPNGQVLLLGGMVTSQSGDSPASGGPPESGEQYFLTGSAEVYDPATQRLLQVSDPSPTPRAFHQAVLLDGMPGASGGYRILVAGGIAASNATLPALYGANTLRAAPIGFRFSIDTANAVSEQPEIVTYTPRDATAGGAPTLSHAPLAALAADAVALAAGAPLGQGGLALAGGLSLGGGAPSASSAIVVGQNPASPVQGALADARAGGALVPLPDSSGHSAMALLVGGTGTSGQMVAPFERVDLGAMPAGTAASASDMAFPLLLLPTVTLLDPGVSAPRVLVSGGLQVLASSTALEPPTDAALHLVTWSPSGPIATAGASAFSGFVPNVDAGCATGSFQRVAFDAATLLASADGFLAGDRVLITGGTPDTSCALCADGSSHSCAIAQGAVVTVAAAGSALPVARADSLQVPRFGHTQSILPDHTLLIAGGLTHVGGKTYGATSVEIWNSARASVTGGPGSATGDADDPLKAELAARGLTRAPAALATDGKTAAVIPCDQPHK